ncbi:MAG: Nif3-like dinuclear metal center hexameric protein [Chthoniobacterales bacterium]
MLLTTITTYLDTLLNTALVSDHSNAKNGLQLANNGNVTRIVVAVDACQAVIEEAIEQKADLLIVHHGLFWQGLQPLTGAFYKKIKLAMDHNLAIYSSHIPLDLHPTIGNNVLLACALTLYELRPALRWQGESIGVKGSTKPITRDKFLKKVGTVVEGPIHLAPGGPSIIKKVLIVTGGAGSEVAAAFAEGVDTFVTGEGPHWSYTTAEELGINLIYAGHYATETFGVKALGEMLSKKFQLAWSFIHHPTGL